jgi:hypothetical protein
MKALGLALAVGGWAIAVGGLLASDATGVRMIAALIGFAVALGGIGTLNTAHLEHAFWKAKRS